MKMKKRLFERMRWCILIALISLATVSSCPCTRSICSHLCSFPFLRFQIPIPLTEDSKPHASVPAGATFDFMLTNSKVFPGTKQKITVYVPAEYDPAHRRVFTSTWMACNITCKLSSTT